MIPVDALFFDLDGTLIDSKRDLAHSVQFLQKTYGAPASSEKEVASFIGDGVVKLVQRAMPKLPPKNLGEAVTFFKHHYREHCVDHTRPYAGVQAALRHFHKKKLAVVTNKPVRLSARILDHLGLSSRFTVLIGGDSLPNKKPHPEPILSALATLRLLDPKRVVMIGDGPNDILSGRRAGTITCGIKSNIGDPEKLLISKPDYVIFRLTELARIFD